MRDFGKSAFSPGLICICEDLRHLSLFFFFSEKLIYEGFCEGVGSGYALYSIGNGLIINV